MPNTIRPEQVSVSHAYTLVSQLFDAFDGLPPKTIADAIDELFKETCALEGANSDGGMTLYGKLMYVGHFIAQQEAMGTRPLGKILEKIQSTLSLVKQDPLLYQFLGINKMFVDAILSKKI